MQKIESLQKLFLMESGKIVSRLEAMIPILPNVDIKRKPTEEQLLHTPDMMLNVDPENNEPLLIFSLECLIT